jgi:hypothetical protein
LHLRLRLKLSIARTGGTAFQPLVFDGASRRGWPILAVCARVGTLTYFRKERVRFYLRGTGVSDGI